MNFADKLIEAIKIKQSPICVGLDPRLEQIPEFITEKNAKEFSTTAEAAAHTIFEFNKGIIDAVVDLVPVIKPQSAFYELYGHHGWWALEETIHYAHTKGLLVILDAKRNDIGTTAEAYSAAAIGKVNIFGDLKPSLNADAVTVTPYLGSDGIKPFLEDCKKYDKGIIILVKTSNPSSADIQDLLVQIPNSKFSRSNGIPHTSYNENQGAGQIPMYEHLSRMVHEWGSNLIGSSGYSSVGAVVGATYPEEAKKLRSLMPHTIFLVPGYGAQGGTARDVLPCFNKDGLGAIINSSRDIIFAYQKSGSPPKSFADAAREAVLKMRNDINNIPNH